MEHNLEMHLYAIRFEMISRVIGTFLLVGSAAFAENLNVRAEKAFEKGHFKEAIQFNKQLADEAPPEKKGEYLVHLAKSYFKDQELGKAIETFITALNETPAPLTPYVASGEDQRLYREALEIYLNPSERDAEVTALKLHDMYAGILRLHPDYYTLGYLVAVSYANLNRFDQFFDVFYASYKKIPQHYLSYKTQAILHIKLYERGKTVEEKEKERAQILNDLEEAKKINPKDQSLYRLQIAFSAPSEKKERLVKNLKEILNDSIVIPRSDLSFYFDQLLSYGEDQLAKELLQKARGWYPYSRTLDSAKEMLEETK